MLTLPVLTRRWDAPDLVVPVSRTASFSWSFTALALAAAVLWLAPMPLARADIEDARQRGQIPSKIARNPPASPEPRHEEIDPGDQVEITLEAHGGGGRSIQFDFATQPQHGQLVGFHVSGRNTAVVTYVHDAASGPGRDQFTYRAQAAGMAMSGAVPVDIDIREFPPRVVVSPAELDFGAVDAGKTSRAQLTVRNEGGGLATGRVEPPDPWAVEGKADFRLNAGEKQVFQVVFKPRGGRSFSETVRVGDYGTGVQRTASVRLIGTGLGPAMAAAPQLPGVNGAPPIPEDSATAAIAAAASRSPAGEPVKAAPTPAGKPIAAVPGGPAGSPANDRAKSSGVAGNGAGTGTEAAPGFEAPPVVLNEAGVKSLQPRSHSRTTLEIAWKQPQPLPSKYRIELRYLSLRDDELIVDWQPYSKVEYQVKGDLAIAALRDLPAGTNQSIRVVAVDAAGRYAAPSRILQVQLDEPLRWWRLSLLQWLLIALVICGVLVVRKRLQDRQILAQISVDRRARERAEA